MLCQYKNIFGKPNQGIHSYRIANIAIVDLILTIILAYIISQYMNNSFIYVFMAIFITGILLHRLFCVNTTINQLIFGKV